MDRDLERLTPRQRGVLSLLAEGHSNKEIAIALGLSQHTVKSYVEAILAMLAVPNRAAASARWANAQARREPEHLHDPLLADREK